MTDARCYRVTNDRGAVEVRGISALDALVAYGYGVVSEIDCVSGTITAQADVEYVAQGELERVAFEALPEEEQRALRRAAGGITLTSVTAQPDATWG